MKLEEASMTNEIKRATGLLVIEVRNSNPNGDPDQESDPRQRPHDERGLISPVSFKRKLRDLVADKEGPVWQALKARLSLEGPEDDPGVAYEILESRGRDRNRVQGELADGSFIPKYWDGRVFGNTFLEEGAATTLRTGVAQFALGESVAPIEILRLTNTSKAGVEEGKDRGMAPLAYRVVQHGVYTMPFFVNPSAAVKSGCRSKDVELLLALIPLAYAHTASYIRPFVEVRHAWYVEHRSSLGSASDAAIVDALTPHKKSTADRPSTSWDEYDVPTALPDAVAARMGGLRDLVADLR
jgi:CRISPR-associated protein Csd2